MEHPVSMHTPPCERKILVHIHKNEQLLDLPFTRLLLEALLIKASNYLQVTGIDL